MTDLPASVLHYAPAPHKIAGAILRGPRPHCVPHSLALAAMLVKDLVS
jgi:hypothetical protein